MRLKPRPRRVVPAPKGAAPKPAPPEAPPAPPTLPLAAVWREATQLYANAKGMRPRRSWWFGLSERAGGDRLSKVTERPAARRLAGRLAQLSDVDARLFETRAALNLDQALAAMRVTLVMNLTLPVATVLFVNGLLPGGITGFFGLDEGDVALLGVAIGLAALSIGGLLWYVFAGLQQARDLHHLALLDAARRGHRPGMLSSADSIDARV
jgi:hypothetical protein